MVRYHTEAVTLPVTIVSPLARCVQLLDHIRSSHPAVATRRCEHLASGSQHLKVWVTTSEDGRGYFSCGGCALKRASFRVVCDDCHQPLKDDGHEVFTAYVDEDCAAVMSVCGPCSDIIGETALLSREELLVAHQAVLEG